MDAPNIRQYEVEARSTETFGRVLCSARTNHFIVDGPVQNGCPGEAMTPPEAFLAGVITEERHKKRVALINAIEEGPIEVGPHQAVARPMAGSRTTAIQKGDTVASNIMERP